MENGSNMVVVGRRTDNLTAIKACAYTRTTWGEQLLTSLGSHAGIPRRDQSISNTTLLLTARQLLDHSWQIVILNDTLPFPRTEVCGLILVTLTILANFLKFKTHISSHDSFHHLPDEALGE